VSHSPHYRAWRDGFHGREIASACTSYLAAYSDGLRDGDRTRALAGRPHAAGGHASPSLSGLVSDPPCVVSGGGADPTTDGAA